MTLTIEQVTPRVRRTLLVTLVALIAFGCSAIANVPITDNDETCTDCNLENAPLVRCRFDTDCEGNHRCVGDGECAECQDDADCDYNSRCDDGVCAPVTWDPVEYQQLVEQSNVFYEDAGDLPDHDLHEREALLLESALLAADALQSLRVGIRSGQLDSLRAQASLDLFWLYENAVFTFAEIGNCTTAESTLETAFADLDILPDQAQTQLETRRLYVDDCYARESGTVEEREETIEDLMRAAGRFGVRGDYDGAVDALEEALDLGATDADIYLMLYQNHAQLGNYDDAADALEEYLNLRPNARNADDLHELLDELRR